MSSATVGAVVAARRPAHPVGWLLLGIALSLTGTAATAQYFVYGLLVRPGALPVARYAVLYQPATTFTALTLIGFVLLLTPTGSLPSPRWRWLARVMAVTPVVLVLVVSLVGGPVDPRYQALGGPFDLRGLDGVLLAANRTALAVTVVGLVAGRPRPWSGGSGTPAGWSGCSCAGWRWPRCWWGWAPLASCSAWWSGGRPPRSCSTWPSAAAW